jgi:primosomal protein N' (replication factor Y)
LTRTDIYTDVILPLPVRGFFTYNIPDEFAGKVKPGIRVLVQFGTKKIYTAIVFKVHNNKPQEYETKPVLDILDNQPVVNKYQIRLWEWAADYYMCSIGDFYKASVPAGLRLESETKVIVSDNINADVKLNSKEQLIVDTLNREAILTINEIAKNCDLKNPVSILKKLQNKGVIIIQEHLKTGYKAKTIKKIHLAKRIDTKEKIHKSAELLKKAPKQQKLFLKFIDYFGIDDALKQKQISKQKLLEISGASPAILKSLTIKNILKEVEVDISRLSENSTNITGKKKLNKNQQKALTEIKNNFKQKDTVLLHGVTSSGKTEIYIHLIEDALKNNKQVLYLLPEIALTSQIILRLKAVFGKKVGVYHSKFSDAERVEIWNNLIDNTEESYQIILGVRSSIFLPFNNLGLIIVDEEHENTYKQFDPSPRYNARDLAVVSAVIHKAKVLLGTATPAIESYYNAKTGRYGLVELFQRHKNIKLPKIMIADLKKAHNKKQMLSHFTPMLIDNIEEALNNNEQVILFQNRRGFSPFLECSSCGWVPKCKWCDVSLTYHKKINKLICHYCGYSIDNIYRCSVCNQPSMETKGFGTEKIEDEIAIIFPDAKIARLDIDTSRGKYGHEVIINDFQEQNIDILIGTQMVSKGLDFDHVSVVGILSADSMLRFPDFRAYERSYQLMAQVSGRAGRKNKQGKVIIQTFDTENIIINQVINNNYELMFNHQLNERRQFFYPPFSRLIKVTIKHRDKNILKKVSYELAELLKTIPDCKILGPTTPPIIRIQNYFIKNIMIKIKKTNHTAKTKNRIEQTIESINSKKGYKATIIIIDVDPM